MLRNLALGEGVITFQTQVCTPQPDDSGPLVLCQYRGRALPVVAARFARHLSQKMEQLRNLPPIGEVPGISADTF